MEQVIKLLKGFEIKKKGDTEEDEVEKKDLKEEGNMKVTDVKESDVNKKEEKDSEIETEHLVDGQTDENVMKEDSKEEKIDGNVRNGDDETEKNDTATEYIKSDEMSKKKGVIVLDRSKVGKSVRFELESDETTEICLGSIQVNVADMFNTVAALQEEGTEHKIDEAYVNFPSSQTKCEEYIEDMQRKENEKEVLSKEEENNNQPYTVETEDITDDERNKEDTSDIRNEEMVDTEEKEEKNNKEDKLLVEEKKNNPQGEENKESKNDEESELKDENICKLDVEQIASAEKKEDCTELSYSNKAAEISTESSKKEDKNAKENALKPETCQKNGETMKADKPNEDATKIEDNEKIDFEKEEEEDGTGGEVSRKEGEQDIKENTKKDIEAVNCEQKEEEKEVFCKNNGDDDAGVIGGDLNLDDLAELMYIERYLKCFSLVYWNYKL